MTGRGCVCTRLDVRVWVCVHTTGRACVGVCAHDWTCMCGCVCTRLDTCVGMCAHDWTRVWVCVHTTRRACVGVCARDWTCVYVR